LQKHKARVVEREYGKTPLNEAELRELIGDDPIAPFLNTRTALYRERNMKMRPPTRDEAIQLMLRDQNLLKRPVLIKGRKKVVGWDEKAARELI
jgi:arsenate reductase